ncbi:MAG: hypothetical protein LBR79_04565 [Oscillospiraceae bacterium]|nr:hypothetical protein [Oscillospiraceae bacterium]
MSQNNWDFFFFPPPSAGYGEILPTNLIHNQIRLIIKSFQTMTFLFFPPPTRGVWRDIIN